MSWNPAFLLQMPNRPWMLDATQMGVTAERLDELAWSRAFSELELLESGALVNASEYRQVGHYWLRAPERAPTLGQAKAIGEAIEAVRAFAAAVRTGAECAEDGIPFMDVLHIGIGGSALAPMLLVDALGRPGIDGALRVHFLDNTDPDGIARVLDALGPRLRHSLVVLVSKSGSTPEPNNAYALVARALSEQGLDVASRSIAISCEGSALWKRAEKERWRRLFPMWDWVGGRVSVCCAVGLLPGDLAGVDTAAFLAGARDMDEWTRTTSWRENPAALMAGGWYLVGSGHGDRAMVVLPYSDRLALLSRHLQQLVMESLGKKHDRQGNVVHQGLVVYGNKGSTDQHAYVQQLRDGRDDFFAVFVQVLGDGNGDRTELGDGANAGDYLQGFLLGTRRALREGGRPSLTITIPAVDAYALGGIFALFERAVSLYGSLVDVNAYDQPGVEAGKKAACEVLLLCARLREALGPTETELPALAAKVNADVVEVFYVLERWCATGRAVRVAQPGTPRYRASRGSDA